MEYFTNFLKFIDVETFSDAGILVVYLLIGLIPAYYLRKYARRLLRKYMGIDPITPEEAKMYEGIRTRIDTFLSGGDGAAVFKMYPPILYLQGHVREGEGRVYSGGTPMRIQFFLNSALGKRGAIMVGIGGKDSEVTKLIRTDDQWEDTFYRLAEWVNVIIMRPFHTPGAIKEFRFLLENSPGKLIVIMDPVDTNFDEKTSTTERYESEFMHDDELLNTPKGWNYVQTKVADLITLPDYRDAGGFLGFSGSAIDGIGVEYLPFNEESITSLVEDRDGFIQRYATVRICLPDPFGKIVERDVDFPVYKLLMDEDAVLKAATEDVQSIVFLNDMVNRELTKVELDTVRKNLSKYEPKFIKWLTKEEVIAKSVRGER